MCGCNATAQHGICRGSVIPLFAHCVGGILADGHGRRAEGVCGGERCGTVGRVCCVRERVMSSYVMYCRAQAAECARRAKLASSPELAAERRDLGLRLAQKAKATPLGRTPAAPAEQTERR
jgi:hypothetical protein